MAKKALPPFWLKFQVIAYVVAGLAALVTVIKVGAVYIEMPVKVEAAQQTADGVRKDFNEYLSAQEQATIAQEAYTQAQQQFNQQLLQLQQQQAQQMPLAQRMAPNQAASSPPPRLREY